MSLPTKKSFTKYRCCLSIQSCTLSYVSFRAMWMYTLHWLPHNYRFWQDMKIEIWPVEKREGLRESGRRQETVKEGWIWPKYKCVQCHNESHHPVLWICANKILKQEIDFATFAYNKHFITLLNNFSRKPSASNHWKLFRKNF